MKPTHTYILLLFLCLTPIPACSPQLPLTKIQTMVIATQKHDKNAIPKLVNQLEDPDPSVRMFAIRCLKQITGKTMGYKHYHPIEKRTPCVNKWIQYVKDNSKRPD